MYQALGAAGFTFGATVAGPHYSCPGGTTADIDNSGDVICRDSAGSIFQPFASAGSSNGGRTTTGAPTIAAPGISWFTIALVAGGLFFGTTLLGGKKKRRR